MWIYLVILAIALVMSFQPPRVHRRHKRLLAFFVVLWVFIGFRYEVGPDWSGYTNIYELVAGQQWSDIARDREPGFFLINKISEGLGWGLYGVNAIGAVIFLVGLYKYATRTANPWLATAAVLPFFVFVVAMSGVRQAAAIGIVLGLLAHWDKTSLRRKLLVIALAATMHNSALFMLVFVLWDGGRYPWLRIVVGSLALIVGVRVLDRSGATDIYALRYLEKDVESGGAFYHVGLSAFPALLYLLFRRQIAAHGWYAPLMFRASLVAIGLLPLVLMSSTGASRLSLYLSFVQMWVFPAFVAAHGRRWMGATAFCVLYFLAIFVVYFTMGTHSDAYIPYENVFWSR
jgi:hypothetical protein